MRTAHSINWNDTERVRGRQRLSGAQSRSALLPSLLAAVSAFATRELSAQSAFDRGAPGGGETLGLGRASRTWARPAFGHVDRRTSAISGPKDWAQELLTTYFMGAGRCPLFSSGAAEVAFLL